MTSKNNNAASTSSSKDESKMEETTNEKEKGSATTNSTSSMTTITEGSAVMSFPSNQESTVFYNPVQVQNRDLSILIISLYVQRRAIRLAVKQKRKQLYYEMMQRQRRQVQHLEQQQQQDNNDKDGSSNNDSKNKRKKKKVKLSKEEREAQEEQLEQKLKEYEATLKGYELIKQSPNNTENNDKMEVDNTTTSTTNTNNGTNGNNLNSNITILDALAASGLRSIRYWKEIPGIRHVTINDMESAAIQRANDNIQRNKLQDILLSTNCHEYHEDNKEISDDTDNKNDEDIYQRPYGICINHGDATHEMYMSRRPQSLKTLTSKTQRQQQPRWDVIDLDPYGSAAPFVDGAVQAVEDGGLLCITCTDMAALGGSHPETAYGRYDGSLPIQSARYLQELALRILLQSISKTAAKYGRTIKPILSVGMAFYVRVFVEVYDDKQGVNDLSLNIGHVYQSTKAPTFICLPDGQMGGKKGTVYQSIRLSTSLDYHRRTKTDYDQSNDSKNDGGDGNADDGKTEDDQQKTTTTTTTASTASTTASSSSSKASSSFNCPQTGAPFKVGGPMWMGPLHDTSLVEQALSSLKGKSSSSSSPSSSAIDISTVIPYLATKDRLIGLLTSVSEELPDVPLYYTLPDLCKTLRCNSPPMVKITSAIRNAGYDVSGYHKEPNAIKTNAPPYIIWDIMKAWVKQLEEAKKEEEDGTKNEEGKQDEEGKMGSKKISNKTKMQEESSNNGITPREMILSQPMTINVDFTLNKGSKNINNKEDNNNGNSNKKISRFPKNPQAHWGPKRKAISSSSTATATSSNNDDTTNSKNNDPSSSSLEEPATKRTALSHHHQQQQQRRH